MASNHEFRTTSADFGTALARVLWERGSLVWAQYPGAEFNASYQTTATVAQIEDAAEACGVPIAALEIYVRP